MRTAPRPEPPTARPTPELRPNSTRRAASRHAICLRLLRVGSAARRRRIASPAAREGRDSCFFPHAGPPAPVSVGASSTLTGARCPARRRLPWENACLAKASTLAISQLPICGRLDRARWTRAAHAGRTVPLLPMGMGREVPSEPGALPQLGMVHVHPHPRSTRERIGFLAHERRSSTALRTRARPHSCRVEGALANTNRHGAALALSARDAVASGRRVHGRTARTSFTSDRLDSFRYP